jgi:4-hydroxybenzoate polyprenyltransferase
LIGRPFLIIVLLYLVNNILYSWKTKHIVILDVASIAFGFVLRVLAGTAAIDVEPSSWLIMCTIMLAFFLGFAKRRHELVFLDRDQEFREVLGQYSKNFLDQMITIAAACSVMSYAMYTVSPKALTSFGSTDLLYTVPFVLLGIFRYLFLIHIRNTGGSPTKVLLTDLPLMINVLLWLVTCVVIVYPN